MRGHIIIFCFMLPVASRICSYLTESGQNGVIFFNPTERNDSVYCFQLQFFTPDKSAINAKVIYYSMPKQEELFFSFSVYDGSNETDKLLLYGLDIKGLYKNKRQFNSSQNSMLVVVEKNIHQSISAHDKDALIGIEFTAFPAKECICPSKSFTGAGDDLKITSPLYNLEENYCNNLNCTYLIEVDKAYRVILGVKAEYFSTELDRDVLIGYDGDLNGDVLFNISGMVFMYLNVKSSANRMTLQFLTDSSITHAGFMLYYDLFQDVCGCPSRNYLEDYGQVRSPGYPYPWRQCNLDDKLKNCSYLIIGQEHQFVYLNFSVFNLNNDSYLEIFDGNSSSGIDKLMANLTFLDGLDVNETSLLNYTSTSTHMFLRFVLIINDDLVQHFHSGFEADFWLIDDGTAWPQEKFPYAYVIAGIIILLLLPLAVLLCHKRIKKVKRKQILNLMRTFHRRQTNTTMSNNYRNTVSESENPDEWEICPQRLDIDFEEPIGTGAFGEVYKAKLRQATDGWSLSTETVAVKTLGEYANIHSMEAFLSEIECMKSIPYCQYLVNLHGCCTKSENYCLVMEFCENGDLLSYVKRVKNEQNIDDLINQFHSVAWQIACGMEYLSSKKLIHRDLAARNILVDKYKRAKIADFGLCRFASQDIYVTKGGRLPIKWMAIESIQRHLFTTKSDVWSYGVLLYEIYSLGQQPFEFIEPRDLLQMLLDGERLERCEYCPQNIYNIMQWCWNQKPENRPSFEGIKLKIENILKTTNQNEVNYLDVGSL